MSEKLKPPALFLLLPVFVGLLGLLAVGWVVWTGRLPLLSLETTPPLIGAAIALVICFYGWVVVGKALTLYNAEGRELHGVKSKLHQLATEICEKHKPENTDSENEADNTGASARVERVLGGSAEAAKTPLLARRLTSLVRAVDRGAPLLETDYALSEDRHFPKPEREVRSLMDIALNTGIAGTFLSLLLTFASRNTSLTADTLLTHLGPGLISGMAGVFCNVSLRLSHGALLERQSALADEVDWLLAEDFVHLLPRALTSSEERLADTVRKQVTKLAELLTTQLKEPIGAIKDQTTRLADSATALEKHSGKWGTTAISMESSINLLLTKTEKMQLKNALVLDQFVRDYDARATTHQNDLKLWAETLLTEEQEKRLTQNKELVESALTAYNDAAGQYLTRITAHTEEIMSGSKEAFAEAVKDSLSASLSQSATLIDDLRTEVGKLAAHLAQISQSIERQLLSQQASAEGWETRAATSQVSWERILTTAQAAQESLTEKWQISATESLKRISAALELAATTSGEGNTALATELAALKERVTAIAEPLRQTEQAFASMTPAITSASEAFQATETAITTSLAQTTKDVKGLSTSLQGVSADLSGIEKTSGALGKALTTSHEHTENLTGAITALKQQLEALEKVTGKEHQTHTKATTAASDTLAALTGINKAADSLSVQFSRFSEQLQIHSEKLSSFPVSEVTSPKNKIRKEPDGELQPLEWAGGVRE